MAITLTQINAVLTARDMQPIDESARLHAALDYALGVYGIPLATLNAAEPSDRLILGIALLTEQAPFTSVAVAGLKSSEVENDGMSIKEVYADAPSEQFPIIAGILAPFTAKPSSSGMSFGVSTR